MAANRRSVSTFLVKVRPSTVVNNVSWVYGLENHESSGFATAFVKTAMAVVGHLRRLRDVHATSGFPPITAEKRTFRFGRVPSSTAEPKGRAVIHRGAR